VARPFPLQPEGQRLSERLGPGKTPLVTKGIKLIALAIGQIHDRTHELIVI
jgi:hypothetical protein